MVKFVGLPSLQLNMGIYNYTFELCIHYIPYVQFSCLGAFNQSYSICKDLKIRSCKCQIRIDTTMYFFPINQIVVNQTCIWFNVLKFQLLRRSKFQLLRVFRCQVCFVPVRNWKSNLYISITFVLHVEINQK